jgi:hypothetical protein
MESSIVDFYMNKYGVDRLTALHYVADLKYKAQSIKDEKYINNALEKQHDYYLFVKQQTNDTILRKQKKEKTIIAKENKRKERENSKNAARAMFGQDIFPMPQKYSDFTPAQKKYKSWCSRKNYAKKR